MSDKKKKYDEDDGRTIADMSSIDRQLPLGMGFVRDIPVKKPQKSEKSGSDREIPEWESTLSREERKIYVFAALKAAMLIGGVFLLGLGGVIVLLMLLWN
jgi:hypothetical protein